ncbi:heterokaryon incompatibility protein-domain-containing protein [Bisporella sp. PMI_857]|nr:heterokaryon incompatibility protein-domain-containing protein [Bisporella sp. PMI_857]
MLPHIYPTSNLIHLRVSSLSFPVAHTSWPRGKRHTLHHIRYSSYKYAPLRGDRKFRLLKLLQGSPTDEIKCELIASSSNSTSQKYVAISYAWGNPTTTHQIQCDGKELGVTANVIDLLKNIRHSNEDKVIWIDALCIDQSNIEERTQQVKLMWQIYSKADSVIVWLGANRDEPSILSSFLLKLSRAFREFKRRQSLEDQPEPVISDAEILKKTGTLPTSPEWIAVKRLFERQWFHRLWVIQEVALSTDQIFWYGNWNFPAQLLEEVTQELRTSHMNGSELLRTLQLDLAVMSKFLRTRKVWRFRQNGYNTPLAYRSYSFWSSEVTDPRDKIFATLGLDRAMAQRIDATYEDSPQRVFIKATEHSLMRNRSTRILSLAGIGHTRVMDGLPSWVPDFTSPEIPVPPFSLHRYGGDISQDADLFHKKPKFECENGRLKFDGVMFDTVNTLSNILELEAESNLKCWLDEVDNLFLVSRYANNADATTQWRSLIADRVFQTTKYIYAPAVYDTYFKALKERIQVAEDPYLTIQPEDDTVNPRHPQGIAPSVMMARRYITALWQSARNRRYCVTMSGDVGLVPKYAATGDIVILIKGSDVPYLIRPCASVRGAYSLVGECYVHGCMIWEFNYSRSAAGKIESVTLV